MSYATVSQLRTAPYLKQVGTGTANDNALQDVLDRAEQVVNDALGFEFSDYAAAGTVKDVLCRYGGQWLDLPYHLADSVTDVYTVDGRGTSYETTDEVDEWMEEDDGRLYCYEGLSAGTWYRVTAKWGYGAAPAQIVEVELEVAVNLWMGADAGNSANTVGVDGQGTRSFNRALTWAQRSIIDGVRMKLLGMVHA